MLVGLGVLGLGWSALGASWIWIRHELDGRRAAHWEREWKRIEPEWSRQAR